MYTQSSELQKLLNWDILMSLPRCAGGHDEQMKSLFKGAAVLSHWNEGDYQGSVATWVRLEDGRSVVTLDSYGSCSGCDAWEDASDTEVRNLCVLLSNDSYIFDNWDDAMDWLIGVASGERVVASPRWAGSDAATGLIKNFDRSQV